MATELSLELKPRLADVVLECAEAGAVVADADALLLHLLQTSRLDWAHGGQFLHLTYLLERLVAGLVERDVRLVVVFFATGKSAWASCEGAWGAGGGLARSAAKAHLRSLGVSVETRFSAPWSDEWEAWVQEERPSAIMLCDRAEVEALEPVARLQRAVLAHSLLVTRVHCVHLAELEFRDFRAIAFMQAPFSSKAAASMEGLPSADDIRERGEALQKEHEATKAATAAATAASKSPEDLAAAISCELEGGMVSAVTAAALAGVAREGKTSDVPLLRAMAIHAALLSELPLPLRAQTVGAMPSPILGFVVRFERSASGSLEALPAASSACAVPELLDGRLLQRLLEALPELDLSGEGSAAVVRGRAEALWEAVARVLGRDVDPAEKALLTAEGRVAGAGLADVPSAPPAEALTPPPPAPVLFPIENNVLLDTVIAGTPAAALPTDPAVGSTLAAIREREQRFEDIYGWQAGKLIEPAYIAEGKVQGGSDLEKYKEAPIEMFVHKKILRGRERNMLGKRIDAIHRKIRPQLVDERRAEINKLRTQVDEWLVARIKQQEQKAARYMHQYAASLTGTKFQRGRVIVSGSSDAAAERPSTAKGGKGGGGKGGGKGKGGESAKDRIIRENKEREAANALAAATERWDNIRDGLERSNKWSDVSADKVLELIKGVQAAPQVACSAALFYQEKCLKRFKDSSSQRKAAMQGRAKTDPMPVSFINDAVRIMHNVQDMVTIHLQFLASSDGEKPAKKMLRNVQKLGFGDAAAEMAASIMAVSAELAKEEGAEEKERPSTAKGGKEEKKEKKEKEKRRASGSPEVEEKKKKKKKKVEESDDE
mmetsp:Transcript_25411/g.83563  ORF Transcript_25411/g.83563 Transcript_25411/m.83563 type:complete len:832 (+) Transcript_25411:16-2511(+)